MIWANKYYPKKLDEVLGEKEALHKLEDFILNYKKQRKRAMILYGPTGSGKTCAVYAIARENDLEVMEMNASMFRNKDHINDIVGNSINQASLFSKAKLILIDEIDGLEGTKDRGGIQALLLLLSKSNFPIVLTANDIWQDKLSSLRSKSILLKFEPLRTEDVLALIKKISESEGINLEDKMLKKIASNSGGDARAAINDLQVLLSLENIKESDLLEMGNREKKEEIFNILRLIFKSYELEAIKKKSELSDVNIDDLFLWIEENIPSEYSRNNLSTAYDNLSKADVFRGRIKRGQYWRLLVYQRFLMSESVALAKTKVKTGFVQYKRSGRILKVWQAKMKYQKRKSICDKLSKTLHISSKRAMKEVFPYFIHLLKKKKFIEKFGFDDDEIKFLNKM